MEEDCEFHRPVIIKKKKKKYVEKAILLKKWMTSCESARLALNES